MSELSNLREGFSTMVDTVPLKFLSAPGYAGSQGDSLAYKKSDGRGPTLIWCGGLKSDMEGGKATHLHKWAVDQGRGFIRFDYFGHGQSTGRFRDGTMSRWARDVVQVIDELAGGDVILIGSSMGGWSSLLATGQRQAKVKALVLIAPAPDFTEKLMWASFSDEQRQTLMNDGILYVPSDYDEPYEYSRELIEDGRQNLLLDAPIKFSGPVRILQGAKDDVVPWEYSHQLSDSLTSQDITYSLVKNGDHSLSCDQGLGLLVQAVEDVCQRV